MSWTEEHRTEEQLRSQPSRLNRMTVRGLLALAGLVTAMWLGPNDPLALSRAAGGVALAAGVIDLVVGLREAPGRARRRLVLRAAAWMVLGAILVGNPVRSIHVLGRLVALGLAAFVAVDVAFGFRREQAREAKLLLAQAIAGVVTIGIMLAWPSVTARLTLGAIAATWIVAGLIVAVRPAGEARFHLSLGDALAAVGAWLREREMPPDARARLEGKLFFEGGVAHARRVRFFGLLFLSVAIATLGILTDSTAVVVGAMVVAPLMTPIMALAASLVSGRPQRATPAGVLVAGGVLLAVAASALLAHVLPVFEGIDTNDQITSRVSPTVLDLMIALAAGTAGAFALSREDIADSLPGVAIAVALVPPLGVAGVTLQAGAYQDTAGAMLLFLTNLVSMLLAGGLMFVVLGLVPIDQLYQERERVRVYASTVLAGTLIVAAPLGIVSRDLAEEATSHHDAEVAAERWVARSDGAELVQVTVDGETVAITAAGEHDPPPTDELAEELAGTLGRPIEVELRWIRELRTVARSGDSG